MAFDYSGLAAVAVNLIDKFGRSLTLNTNTDAALPDSQRPWEPAANASAPDALFGVVVPSSYKDEKGTLVTKGVHAGYIAARDLAVDITTKDTITDGTKTYRVAKADLIKPGPDKLLWILRLME